MAAAAAASVAVAAWVPPKLILLGEAGTGLRWVGVVAAVEVVEAAAAEAAAWFAVAKVPPKLTLSGEAATGLREVVAPVARLRGPPCARLRGGACARLRGGPCARLRVVLRWLGAPCARLGVVLAPVARLRGVLRGVGAPCAKLKVVLAPGDSMLPAAEAGEAVERQLPWLTAAGECEEQVDLVEVLWQTPTEQREPC